MTNELRGLIAQGLQAMKAGGEIAKQATAEIQRDATDPGLRAALEKGNTVAEGWARRIQEAIGEVGPSEDTGNPILEAHYEVSKKIRATAQGAVVRDLGIIAAGRLALHYWIAGFETLRTYAAKVGMIGVQGRLQACLDEAKTAERQHEELAIRIMGGRTMGAGA